MLTILWTCVYAIVHLWFIGRAILRPHREPASRLAWVLVMLIFPGVGILAYILLGDTNIGRGRIISLHRALAELHKLGDDSDSILGRPLPEIPERYVPLFRTGQSINGFLPVEGNRAELMADSNVTIDRLVADIDAAKEHVHLAFYIWLPDNNGLKVVEALKRAVARKVTCRVMADALGSRILIKSPHWRDLQAAGVKVATALPIGNPVLRVVLGRIDLRNHRKIAVIDHRITYCGSQNCADPEFRIKAKYAPWVDTMMRFEGPIARQNQMLFASDWLAQVNENAEHFWERPAAPAVGGTIAQVIGTGPTVRYSSMPEVFESLMFAARRELIITTPYFVPDESMLSALCTCSRRGVTTTIIFPARNDSFIVAAASRSYYHDLLSAGVQIYEYEPGLLHAKTLTIDGEVSLIGSANMDRRSFELNYENNILLYDLALTAELVQRQKSFLHDSHRVTSAMVAEWSAARRLWNNSIAMMGPVL